MIYLRYIGAFLAAYILQTTLLSGWVLRPEFILLIFCLCLSGRSQTSLLLGFLTGLFLDAVNGYGLYNTALYTVVGLLCGFMPVSIFRDLPSLAFVNMLLGSLWLNAGYAVLTRLFLGKAVFLPPLSYAAVLLLDIFFFWLIALMFIRRRAYD